MSATVLLVGGFGNLGGRIAAHLHETADINLVLSSRFHRSAPKWASDARVIQLDLTDPQTFLNIPKHVDSIIQLAAMNDIESLNNPDLAQLVTTDGTIMLLQEAVRRNMSRFIYFSTAHVYGAPLTGHLSETTPTNPAHPYAATHLGAEAAVESAHQHNELIGIRIRLSNGFGRPMDYDSGDWRTLTSDLCRQAVIDRELSMRTDGLQQRNFMTKTDISRAVSHLLSLPATDVDNGLFNVGGMQSRSLLDMAHLIQTEAQNLFGQEISLSAPEPAATEYPTLDFDIDKLVRSGFTPEDNASDEIQQFLKMIAQHHSV